MSAERCRKCFDLRHAESGAPVDLVACLGEHAGGESAEIPILLHHRDTPPGNGCE